MGDLGASILAKLKHKAKLLNLSVQQCQLLFFEEEFLRRLSRTEYVDHFVLKGGLLIFHLTNFLSRPTTDMDFLLRNLPKEKDFIQKIIDKILATLTEYSKTVHLDVGGIKEITTFRQYPGLCVHIIGHFKNVRVEFNMDIGIGDIVIPQPEKRLIQTQLSDTNIPQIATYSLESVISEKFDAILQRMNLTSRMKDFYDIAWLSKTFDFSGRILSEAIEQTLKNRKTPYDETSLKRIIALVNDPGINNQWQFFIKNISETDIPFPEVISQINLFITPIWSSMIDKTEMTKNWSHINGCWQ